MSLFNRERAGYTRLDSMSDLEKRLVRKLGMLSKNPTFSSNV